MDPSPSRGGIEQLADQLASVRRAVDELKAPTGTQQYNAVPALQEAINKIQSQQDQLTEQQQALTALVASIDQRVTDFINSNIDAIVAAKVTEKLASADITIGTAGGTVRIPSIFTTDVTATLRPRVAVWADDEGLIGHT